ncbi:unnamed protein product, partial [marine sediment metagenome]
MLGGKQTEKKKIYLLSVLVISITAFACISGMADRGAEAPGD